MSGIYEHISQKIRELRGAKSQEVLASELKIAPNTLSRWETGTYKPTAEDLDSLARFFKVPVSIFFLDQENRDDRVAALTSATGGLDQDDLDEVIRYAEFRKARRVLDSVKTTKKQKTKR